MSYFKSVNYENKISEEIVPKFVYRFGRWDISKFPKFIQEFYEYTLKFMPKMIFEDSQVNVRKINGILEIHGEDNDKFRYNFSQKILKKPSLIIEVFKKKR